MKKQLIMLISLLGIFGSFGLAGDFCEAFQSGKPTFDLRFRNENVDQANKDKKANATTLRLRLGYTTGEYNGFKFHIDLETIQKLGDERFNSTDNGMTQYPVVADPLGSELNQAYVVYQGFDDLIFKLGRQRIILDNARFVGNVGWRQNEQTYDAYTAVYKGFSNGVFTATNVQRVNRIFGEYHSNPARSKTDTNAYILHYKQKFSYGTLSAYAHLIEFQNPGMEEASHKNLGLRFAGAKDNLIYAAEYAQQSNYKDGADKIDADYSLIELGVVIGKAKLKAGYEVLGGDGTYAFTTPLATLHAFNSWADKFLGTPAAGIVDFYFDASAKLKAGGYPLILKAVYHNFTSDVDFQTENNAMSNTYGSELDALVKLVISKKLNVLLKYADYSADDYSVDTTKLWLMAGYKF